MADILFAINAQVECEGETIDERSHGTKSHNLFYIDEFKGAINKENYIIRRLFVTIHLEELPDNEKNVNVRLYPQDGRITFAGFVNERQVATTISKIEEISPNQSTRDTRFRLDEFF
ncbi:MAG: hypothetical protein IH840_09665 [Candidatus Heimdallarchaeota archaeon]|nr:hypothetical protein [Candidatus Heimdallarchaeota archaeon]